MEAIAALTSVSVENSYQFERTQNACTTMGELGSFLADSIDVAYVCQKIGRTAGTVLPTARVQLVVPHRIASSSSHHERGAVCACDVRRPCRHYDGVQWALPRLALHCGATRCGRHGGGRMCSDGQGRAADAPSKPKQLEELLQRRHEEHAWSCGAIQCDKSACRPSHGSRSGLRGGHKAL